MDGLKINDVLIIKDFFYNGDVECIVKEIYPNGDLLGEIDGIDHLVKTSYFKKDMILKNH